MSYCQLILVGNVGRDVELKYTANGKAVCDFSLATNRTWTDRDTNERKQETTWFKVTCWGNLAELTNEHVTKGQQVMVIADRIEARAYLTRDTNEARASLDVTASQVIFLGRRGESQGDESESSEMPF